MQCSNLDICGQIFGNHSALARKEKLQIIIKKQLWKEDVLLVSERNVLYIKPFNNCDDKVS